MDDGRDVRVDRGPNGLVLVVPDQEPLELIPTGDREWAARAVRARVVFECGDDGQPHRLVVQQDAAYVKGISAVRVRQSEFRPMV
jgi:hypothetical protein